MKNYKKRFCSVILASVLCPMYAIADNIGGYDDYSQSSNSSYNDKDSKKKDKDSSDTETKTLEKQVVSATGYIQDIKDAPASISVVTQEDIQTRPIRDLGDAVQDIPGVSVEPGKTGDNQISMRGLGSAYTLILIDGKRQNVAQGFGSNGFGGALSSMIPPTSMIERIEVIRGPASIIYGSDAMGGVINIITKKHSDKVATGYQLSAQFSQYPDVFGNIYSANAYVTSPIVKNKLSINLRIGTKTGDQNSFRKPNGLTGSNPYNNPYSSHSSTGFSHWNTGTRINWTPSANNSFYLDGEVYYTRAGTLNTSSAQTPAVRDYYKINTIANYDGNYSWGKINSYLQYSQTIAGSHAMYSGANLGLAASRGDYVNWAGSLEESKDIVFQTTYNNNFNFDRFGSLIVQGGFYYLWQNLLLRRSSFQRDMNQYALFGEGQYVINEYVSTTLGVRVNFSDVFATYANPRFFVNVNPTHWLTFKAGVSSGMLAPQLSYLYDGWTTTTATGGSTTATFGNKDLKPETSWNYEISGILDFSKVSLIATGYYTNFNNKIISLAMSDVACSASGAGASICTQYSNVDNSLVTGAEVAFQLKDIYGFSLDANYAFAYTEVLSDSGGTVAGALAKGQPMNSIPRHSFVIKPSYRYKKFDMYVRWTGRFMNPTIETGNARTNVKAAIGDWYKDYQIVDLAFSYKFSKAASLTFAVNNLLDTNFIDYALYSNNASYQNRYQRILPSRNFWLSFKGDF